MIEVRMINEAHKADINLPNEPFGLFGRMEPSYADGRWGYKEILFDKENISEMCFPDEDYDYDELSGDHVFIGAYDGETCVGLAVLAEAWFKYMYLEDLKVRQDYRGQGVGKALLERALEAAHGRNYSGLYTVGQDNNVAACCFYLKMGFEIGGFDNRAYRGTAQEGKADITFYLDR